MYLFNCVLCVYCILNDGPVTFVFTIAKVELCQLYIVLKIVYFGEGLLSDDLGHA